MEYRDALWIAHCYFQESIFSLIPFYCKCKFINLFIILSWNMSLNGLKVLGFFFIILEFPQSLLIQAAFPGYQSK